MMIKKFAYFKNCVYLCTHKTFAVLLAFFKVSVRCGRPAFLKMFRNISEDNLKRMLNLIFEKKVQQRKEAKEKFIF